MSAHHGEAASRPAARDAITGVRFAGQHASLGGFPGLRQLGRALRHRNYRLFFAGQSVSLIGTWLTRVATGWLVYRLTGSAFMLGLVGFAGQVPIFLLGPVASLPAIVFARRTRRQARHRSRARRAVRETQRRSGAGRQAPSVSIVTATRQAASGALPQPDKPCQERTGCVDLEGQSPASTVESHESRA
jgi:hypothetical protein